MTSALKPYPAYKDSGVEWLGEVPDGWDVRRLGTVAEVRVSSVDKKTGHGELPVRLCNYVDVYRNDRIDARRDFMRATASREERERFRLAAGDVPITKDSEAWNDIGVPALVTVPAEDLVCGYHLAILRPLASVLAGGYLFRAIQSQGVAYQLQVGATGVTRYGLAHSVIKSLRLPLPSLPEQRAIARYLDHIDRRIRRLIRAERRRVALLEELKQAIIQQAVTRGLDPNVRLKPSGAEWLGDVPEHWEVTKVRWVFESLDHRRIPLSGVTRGEMTMRLHDYYGASGVIDKVDDFLFDEDLLLIAEDGANLVLRNLPLAIIARGRYWVNNHAHVLRPRRGNIEYLAAVMESLDYRPWISGAAQPKLTQDRLMGISIAVAPPAEQERIMCWANDRAGDAVRYVISSSKRQIELLQEYRTRLIADVVTGKLDVRQVDVPEEAEDEGEEDEVDEVPTDLDPEAQDDEQADEEE